MFNTSLLSLLQLCDPTLPIGGYAHSNGLETYVQQGVVIDLQTAKDFVVQMLSNNLKYTDGAFVSLAYDAAKLGDVDKILALDDECTAVKLPREMREASHKLGMRLMKLFQPMCKDGVGSQYQTAIHQKQAMGHYSIAFGIYACALNIQKREALTGFYYNATIGMITNCVKLVPLGQQDGQLLLFSLQHLIEQVVEDTMVPNEDLIGVCCAGFDIRCMQHEQLYSRLYMS